MSRPDLTFRAAPMWSARFSWSRPARPTALMACSAAAKATPTAARPIARHAPSGKNALSTATARTPFVQSAAAASNRSEYHTTRNRIPSLERGNSRNVLADDQRVNVVGALVGVDRLEVAHVA